MIEILPVYKREDLSDQVNSITDIAWPEFMLHDDYANKYFGYLYNQFPEYQFIMVEDDRVIALGNCVPLSWYNSLDSLPDRGWDWAIEHGVNGSGEAANILCGLQVVIHPEEQGRGLSKLMIRYLRNLVHEHSLEKLILPVRPSNKSSVPEMAISDYIALKREDGFSVDNWIRTHQKEGGRVIKACQEAMHIKGTVDDWKRWTGVEITTSGYHPIPGALVPVKFDLEKNEGFYMEPNVWMVHTIAEE